MGRRWEGTRLNSQQHPLLLYTGSGPEGMLLDLLLSQVGGGSELARDSGESVMIVPPPTSFPPVSPFSSFALVILPFST